MRDIVSDLSELHDWEKIQIGIFVLEAKWENALIAKIDSRITTRGSDGTRPNLPGNPICQQNHQELPQFHKALRALQQFTNRSIR